MAQNDYYDRILLKLKRRFSKDETVSMLNAEIARLESELKDTRIEVGILKSEVAEWEHKYSELKKSINPSKKPKNKDKNRYKKLYIHWRDKWFSDFSKNK